MKKIFLIDDDEDDQFLFKEVLESINPNLDCETATNGKAGLDKLKVSNPLPNIIFLDLNMPIMNGMDFLIQIKKESELAKIPVCIFTTSSSLRDKESTKEVGAQCFLTKPSDFQMLRQKLQQILATDFSQGQYITVF